jgi:hypothetical protein
MTDLLYAPWLATGKQTSRGFQGGVLPWSQGADSCPAREGEAGSVDGIEATVGRGKAKLFPLRVDFIPPLRRGARGGSPLFSFAGSCYAALLCLAE